VTDTELLVVYEPDGLPTTCTDDQVRRITTAWTSVLRWLQGVDPDELPESDLVKHVARKAALRAPRYPEFDIGLWTEQSRNLDHLPELGQAGRSSLAEVGTQLLVSIELKRTHLRGAWLNRVAIELLYNRTGSFQANRSILIPRLLDDPVSIERWTGQRLELAQAIKFLIRQVLSTQKITSLVHMEIMASVDAARVLKAIEIPAAECM
jgi:hypothetical protein